MLLYIIALLPIIVYMLVVKAMDGFSLASWKRLFPSFVWGMSCCGTLFFVPLTLSACCSAIVLPFAIHYVYNLFLLPEFLQLVLVIFLMTGLLLFIYDIDGKHIHKWLDSCISNDISLLASIREGHLKDTSAGEYLLEMRRRFQPEVFFDICAYLGLYLEMSIAAKSRMIIKEAGMDIPTTPETHQENLDRLAELKALKKNIGMSGLMVLRPVINEKAVDEWVIGELL